jgi:hypothetical protein
MFKYRLQNVDGGDLGEATYAVGINPGETVHIGAGERLRVVDVVVIEDEGSDYVGVLKVEASPEVG